jgi:hypothetical protein
MSTLELILDTLDETRERLLVAVEPLDDEALLMKQVVGDWSITDVLTNLTAWESELVTGLMKLDQNKRPGKLLDTLADPDGYDRSFYEQIQDRDLDQVFEDLQLVRVQLEDWLSGFSESDLTKPKRYRWFEGRSLRHIIAQTTYTREEKFLPAIEAFAQTWKDEQNAQAGHVVPLTIKTPTEEQEDILIPANGNTQDTNENSTN